MFLVAATWFGFFVNLLILLAGLVLIVAILIQRGRGGGLIGALGGGGGQSAFGSKAGDTFTKVTIVIAAVWISLNMLLAAVQPAPQRNLEMPPPAQAPAPEVPPAPVP